jgi:nucleoside phosphorylase
MTVGWQKLRVLREKLGKPEIVVITALDEELDYLYEFPLGWSDPKVQKDGISYRRGHLAKDVDVIAASAHSTGLIAAAILAAKVLKEWQPSVAAMIGICGGIKARGVNIGDIVVASQCFHYQFGAFEDGKVIRELRVENTETQVIDIVEHLARRTKVLSEIQQSLPRGFKKPNTTLKCHIGPTASADLVVKDAEKLGEAVEADRKTIAVDMESYAFMRAARLANTRWSFVVKSVSDFADAKKDDEYREYAKYTSARFFIQMAQSLVEGWK